MYLYSPADSCSRSWSHSGCHTATTTIAAVAVPVVAAVAGRRCILAAGDWPGCPRHRSSCCRYRAPWSRSYANAQRRYWCRLLRMVERERLPPSTNAGRDFRLPPTLDAPSDLARSTEGERWQASVTRRLGPQAVLADSCGVHTLAEFEAGTSTSTAAFCWTTTTTTTRILRTNTTLSSTNTADHDENQQQPALQPEEGPQVALPGPLQRAPGYHERTSFQGYALRRDMND